MTPVERRMLLLGCILFLIAGAAVGYAAIPNNTIRQDYGAVMPLFNATVGGYWVGVNQIVSAARAAAFVTVDTGQGANELYDMDQNVLTTSAATFATVNTGYGANELYEMNQDVLTVSNVTFNRVNATEYFLGPDDKTDIFKYPQSEASYIVFVDNSTGTPIYYAKNGMTGQIPFSGTDAATVIQAALTAITSTGGKIFIKKGDYVGAHDILNAKSRTVIEGEAPGNFEGGSVVKFTDLYVSFTSGIAGFAYYGGGIKNIDFESSNNANNVLAIDDTALFTVDSCSFYYGNNQIILTGKSHFALITHSRFNWGNTGIYVAGNSADYGDSPDAGEVVSCTMGENDLDVYLQYCSSWKIDKCYFETGPTNPATHIKIEDSNHVTVSNSDLGQSYTAHQIWQVAATGGALPSDYTKIVNNHFEGLTGNLYHSIFIESGSYPEIIGNTFNIAAGNNAIQVSGGSTGKIKANIVITVKYSAIVVKVSDYQIEDNTVLNIIDTSAATAGIMLDGAVANTKITNNLVKLSSYGIYVKTGSTDTEVIANTVLNCDRAGIIDYSVHSIIQGNLVKNSGIVVGNPGIYLINDYKVVKGNTCYDDQGVKTQTYGITMDGSVDYSIIEGNDLANNLSGGISVAGTNNQIKNNKGYVTESSGTATITALNTSIVVPHGCSYTPSALDVSVVLTNLPTADIGDVYVDTFGAVNFTIHCRNPPGVSTAIFNWAVRRTP